jgi:hypothetical protein
MFDADRDALIEQLQKSNRRWKRLALGLLTALGLTILILTTSATWLAVQIERERQQALAAQEQVRAAEEQARQQSQEARERFEQARKALDEFQQKVRQP